MSEQMQSPSELLLTIAELNRERQYFRIISLLEDRENDYALCLELVRAYINAANQTSDPLSLLDKAQLVLSQFALSGKDDPTYLFYEGYILYKKGLGQDALIRFERAERFTRLEQAELFSKITRMLDICRSEERLAQFKGVSDKEAQTLLEHIGKHFGNPEHLCSVNHVEIYRIAPTAEHDYNLLVSVGLSGKTYKREDGYTEGVELALGLPKDYRFYQDRKGNFEVYLLIEVILALLAEDKPIGFGYYLEKEGGFDTGAHFVGAMLTGMGEYAKSSQSLSVGATEVSFLELLPLRPMELNYRKSHSAAELLEVFAKKLIRITPFIAARPDVVGEVLKV